MDINLLLYKLDKNAYRAILGARITTLEQLAKKTVQEISSMHGIGKNGLELIQATLKENGLSLAKHNK
jgi:hypothetical protein